MGAPSLFNLNPQRAGTIRRVVRRGERYMCGLCRSRYDGEGEAQSCVQSCWEQILELDPVILRRRGLRTVYRCRFCARDHATRRAASGCASDCRTAMSELRAMEVQLLDLPDAPTKKRKPLRKPGAARIGLRLAARPMTRRNASEIESEARVGTDAAPVKVDVNEPPTAVEAAPDAAASADSAEGGDAAAKKAKKKGNEGFYRDGAKYACQECNKRYFTKDEVVKCFESH